VVTVDSGDHERMDGTAEATMTQVVSAAAGLARPGDTVLLAPAAASMDVFRDYAHRGRAFADAVQALG
jgi:UDP-N-acetylmuramoylalanine--D-glutamate ligase